MPQNFILLCHQIIKILIMFIIYLFFVENDIYFFCCKNYNATKKCYHRVLSFLQMYNQYDKLYQIRCKVIPPQITYYRLLDHIE